MRSQQPAANPPLLLPIQLLKFIFNSLFKLVCFQTTEVSHKVKKLDRRGSGMNMRTILNNASIDPSTRAHICNPCNLGGRD
jgi:hypothetical protein